MTPKRENPTDNCPVALRSRYNAEKSKVGMYYTTPVYQFRMKCHLCDNYFVIKTDPAVSRVGCLVGCGTDSAPQYFTSPCYFAVFVHNITYKNVFLAALWRIPAKCKIWIF